MFVPLTAAISEAYGAIGVVCAAGLSAAAAFYASKAGSRNDRETIINQRLDTLFEEQEGTKTQMREDIARLTLDLAAQRIHHEECLDRESRLRIRVRSLEERLGVFVAEEDQA